jgi:hypothetical protein
MTLVQFLSMIKDNSMKLSKVMLAALAVTLCGLGRAQAGPTTVYDLAGPAEFFDQQAGNNMYYYGDDVALAAGAPTHLDTATLTFTYFTNDGTGNYTPNLSLSIFAIDPTTLLPTSSTPLGTASVSNVNFVAGNGDTVPLTLQQVTFDFTSQNVTLPTNFAFAYRDNNPLAGNDPFFGFSVIGSVSGVPTVGSTVNGFLDAYPNDATNHTFQFGVNGQIPGDTFPGNLLATITADSGAVATPEPATLASLAIGLGCAAVYGLRRRKRSA